MFEQKGKKIRKRKSKPKHSKPSYDAKLQGFNKDLYLDHLNLFADKQLQEGFYLQLYHGSAT